MELSKIITELNQIPLPQKPDTRTTYNIGTINGGTSVNTIAQDATMLCEYRSTDWECLEYMKNRFAEVFSAANTQEVSVEVKQVGDRPCSRIDSQKQATFRIVKSLQNDKLVIFISDPERYPQNPFSTGLHYVLAAGIDDKGNILIANSSEKASKGGIQLVTAETIEKSLFEGGTADADMTWGMLEYIPRGCTYVVVD